MSEHCKKSTRKLILTAIFNSRNSLGKLARIFLGRRTERRWDQAHNQVDLSSSQNVEDWSLPPLADWTGVEPLGSSHMHDLYVVNGRLGSRPQFLKMAKTGVDWDLVERRFRWEEHVAGQLNGPQSVKVFSVGKSGFGRPFITYEFICGEDLQRRLDATGPFCQRDVLFILRETVRFLEELHLLGFVHGDLKPSNVMLEAVENERPNEPSASEQPAGYSIRVIDLGISRAIKLATHRIPTLNQPNKSSELVGSPHYLAPELIRDPHTTDSRADIYAVGCMGYCMLTGRPPFGGNNALQICWQQLHHVPPKIGESKQAIDPTLAELIQACMEKSPINRPQSAQEISTTLLHLTEQLHL